MSRRAMGVVVANRATCAVPNLLLRLRMPLTRRGHRLLRNRARTGAVARFTAKGGSGIRTARLIVRRAR